VPALEPILEKLARAQHRLLRAADAVPADSWKISPREGAWSAAELIAHVMTVERTVVGAAARILQKQPKPIPLVKRFHLPFILAEVRLVRMKSPIPIDPQLLREKEVMLAELRGQRSHARIDRRNKEPRSTCLPLAASFSGVAQCIRVVFIFGVASNPARKADARNRCQRTQRGCAIAKLIGNSY